MLQQLISELTHPTNFSELVRHHKLVQAPTVSVVISISGDASLSIYKESSSASKAQSNQLVFLIPYSSFLTSKHLGFNIINCIIPVTWNLWIFRPCSLWVSRLKASLCPGSPKSFLYNYFYHFFSLSTHYPINLPQNKNPTQS